jgi:signal transduction histidine kinase
VLVLALTLLTVSLLRRRRALEAEVVRRSAAEAELTALNASLEQVVEQRTTDLRSMVEGLESFNRSVSHDLRGPLGGISGAARLADDALQRGDDTLARRVLPHIADQAENSTRLVAALLSLAQVGDMALRLQVVDLRRMVTEVVDQLTLEQGGQKMPQIEINPLPQVNADPELLQRVLVNLIGNAIKFTRNGDPGLIEIGATRTSAEIEVFVRDDGVGFESDAAAKLFTPFARLHGAGFAGHGVGLSIVRRAVERHGGRVWAESELGQGAVFRFSLPG